MRWNSEVRLHVENFVKLNPCFFLEELQDELKSAFPDLKNISVPTISRALRFDLKLSRKVLTKLAREARPKEIADFKYRLRPLYLYPEQLVFVDETGKDARDFLRKKAWGPIGKPIAVKLPFARGKRVSALAGFNHSGFLGWNYTPDTFTRFIFHDQFVENILPHLNKWPLPNSIVIIDNARIHMYKEFADAVASRGAVVVFLPPYCPQFNPIETAFASLKQWVLRHAHLVFSRAPEQILSLAFESCVVRLDTPINLMAHSGYDRCELNETIIHE